MSNRDELADIIAGELNKQFKSHQVAYFLDGVQETPTDVSDWISTGSTLMCRNFSKALIMCNYKQMTRFTRQALLNNKPCVGIG